MEYSHCICHKKCPYCRKWYRGHRGKSILYCGPELAPYFWAVAKRTTVASFTPFTIVIFWVSLIVRHGVEDNEMLKCPNPYSVTIFAKLKKDQAHKYQSSAYLRVLVGPEFQSEEEKWTSLISVQSVFRIQSKFAQIKVVGVSGVRLSVRGANPLLPRTLAGLSGSSRSCSLIKYWTLGSTC